MKRWAVRRSGQLACIHVSVFTMVHLIPTDQMKMVLGPVYMTYAHMKQMLFTFTSQFIGFESCKSYLPAFKGLRGKGEAKSHSGTHAEKGNKMCFCSEIAVNSVPVFQIQELYRQINDVSNIKTQMHDRREVEKVNTFLIIGN